MKMGLFDRLFGNRPKENDKYLETFKMLDGYTPRFTSFGGGVYESELIRAAINARATHISKLKVETYGAAKPALQTKLKNNPKLGLVIEGYTCKLGPEEHNRDLAQRRAESIKRLFVEEKGVDPSQIELHTYTNADKENNDNITDPSLEEHRAAIIRIKVME